MINGLTLPAVILAALVDSINPCEFAVLIILLATISSKINRKTALYSGLAFSFTLYISYLLMGIGIYSAIAISGFAYKFYFVVAILAIVLGLLNLKDYFWYGKGILMEVPLSWRPRLQMLIRNVTSVPGVVVVAFLVSLFLLPCTSGPYIVILGLLSQAATKVYAFLLLLLYNLIFILPMLIITFAVYYGFTTTEQMERWRLRQLKVLHLIAGIIILGLGIGMLLALKFGWL